MKQVKVKIYTKTGDKGETGLYGGKRVKKYAIRIQTLGTIDELNAALGLAVSNLQAQEVKELLMKIQNTLFNQGAEIANPEKINFKSTISSTKENDSSFLEKRIDDFESKLPKLGSFILPGGTASSSSLHFARAVCRRAERNLVALSEEESINQNLLKYFNRLSDLLFVLARYSNFLDGQKDIFWNKK